MLAASDRLRIIVGGMVGQFPLGGVAWDYLHYVLGLHELGHEVFYDENTNAWPYDPIRQEPTNDGAFAASFINSFFLRYCPELRTNWHFNLLMQRSYGMTREQFAEVAATADVYLNVSGVCLLPDKLNPYCRKVFIDTDPGFNQIGLLNLLEKEGQDCQRYLDVARHDVFLTYAENINAPECHLPRLGFHWITTRPVVTLGPWEWCCRTQPKDKAFTTVMTLDLSATFNRLNYKDRTYSDKRAEFEKFIDLPSKTHAILRPAIGRHSGLERALKKGWEMIAAYPVSSTPERYQHFIADSYGEWSIAKNIYVEAKSGWFSTRTCCYLVAGRPAVVQDTSWSHYLPSGKGLIGFTTVEEAVVGLERVGTDYLSHQKAAYEIAREYFSPGVVLVPLLDCVMHN
jgi:hypothetical protein